MKPFRQHVAIAVDGGGIKGVIVTRALAILEEHLGQSAHEIFRLAAGTSTGLIISAGIGARLSGAEMHGLYCELGDTVFPRSADTTSTVGGVLSTDFGNGLNGKGDVEGESVPISVQSAVRIR